MKRESEDANDGLPFPGRSQRRTYVVMDAPRDVTAQLRASYGYGHAYGEAPYDSTYAPHGYTEVHLDGLINSYQDSESNVVDYFAAVVRIVAKDFPEDDPMREIILEGPGDVESGGEPIACRTQIRTEVEGAERMAVNWDGGGLDGCMTTMQKPLT